MGRPLGKGRFGRVYLAKERPSQCTVAMKVFQKSTLEAEDFVYQLRREVEIHTRLVHLNIVRAFGFLQDPRNLYLVLEYLPGGSLFQLLRNQRSLSEPEVKGYVRQIVAALQHVHHHNVIHRDVKPENLLLTEDKRRVKLADFGWSVLVKPGWRRRTLCGTVAYLCPEMVEEKSYGMAVDVWCLGVTMFELLAGRTPFGPVSVDEDDAKVLQRIRLSDPSYPDHASPEAEDMLRRILQREASRIGLSQLVAHSWMPPRSSSSWSSEACPAELVKAPADLVAGDVQAVDVGAQAAEAVVEARRELR